MILLVNVLGHELDKPESSLFTMDTKLNGLRFAIYARKSTESEDRQVQSIQDQIERLQKIARENKIQVVEIFRESKSAKEPDNRPQFSILLEKIRSGEIDGILCWAINRLHRNPVDGASLQWLLQKEKLKCIKTVEKSYFPEDNTILLSVETAMATEFIRDLRKNISRGMQSKLDKGILPCLPPLGYVNCPKTRTIIPDEKYFPLVRKMWELMLTGTYTPPKIVKLANEEWGFKTPLKKKVGGTPLSRSSLYKIFDNEFYKGGIIWKGQRYDGIHEKMVTSEEFERVQELIGKREKPSERKREFAYTGIVRCGECGCLITAQEKKKKLKNGSCNYHTYYHCTGKSKYYTCSQRKFIPVKDLEQQIEKRLLGIQIIPEFRDFALELLKEKHQEEVKDRAVIEDNLTSSIKSTQSKLDNLIEMRINNLLTDDEFLDRKKNLSMELKELKLKRQNTETRAQDWRETAEQVFNFALYAVENFENGNPKKRKEILLSLGQNLEIKDKELALGLNKWIQNLEDEQENIEREFKRSEPEKNRSMINQNGYSKDKFPSWYTR